MNSIEKVPNQSVQGIQIQLYQEPIGTFIPQIQKGTAVIKEITTIDSPESLQAACNTLNKAKTLNQLIAKKVDEVCRPFKDMKAQCDDAQRKVKAYAEEITKDINEASKELGKKILVYHQQEKEEAARVRKVYEETLKLQQDAVNKAREQKEAEARNAGIPVPDPEPPLPVTVFTPVIEPSKIKGLTSVWKYEVIDANKVPREFMTPDHGKINAAVKAGTRDIPGVKITEESQIRKV